MYIYIHLCPLFIPVYSHKMVGFYIPPELCCLSPEFSPFLNDPFSNIP